MFCKDKSMAELTTKPSSPHNSLCHAHTPWPPCNGQSGKQGEEIEEQRHAKDLCSSASYKPVRRSLALEDAVPRAFWAEHVYWPQ